MHFTSPNEISQSILNSSSCVKHFLAVNYTNDAIHCDAGKASFCSGLTGPERMRERGREGERDIATAPSRVRPGHCKHPPLGYVTPETTLQWKAGKGEPPDQTVKTLSIIQR